MREALIAALLVMALGYTFFTIAVGRQIAVLKARIGVAGVSVPHGPELGDPTPRSLRRFVDKGTPRAVLFVDDSCAACTPLLEEARARSGRSDAWVVVRRGPSVPGEDDAILNGDHAEKLFRDLRIEATPFAIAVTKDITVAKGYVSTAASVDRLAKPLEGGDQP